MGRPESVDAGFFEGGPPRQLQRALGVAAPHKSQVVHAALLAAMVVWLPLPVLSAIQGLVLGENKMAAVMVDFTSYARYLIATPLFILIERFTLKRLGETASHFVKAGLVPDSERIRFDAIAAQTRRLLDSVWAEALIIVAAYAVVVILFLLFPASEIPAWHRLTDGSFTWAGWWHIGVSVPVSVMLLFAWLWRIFLWWLFLSRVSALELRLIGAHPDRAAGLQFIGASLRTFLPLAFVLSTIVVGAVAERVVHGGTPLLAFKFVIIVLIAVLLFLFVGPVLLFTGKLTEARRRGILEYGALVAAVGHELERKWLVSVERVNETALDVPHFSATTDLYQVASNVYDMKILPLDLRDVIAFAVAVLLPFLPVLIYVMPLNVILPELMKLLL